MQKLKRRKRLKKIGIMVWGSKTYKNLSNYYRSDAYLDNLQKSLG